MFNIWLHRRLSVLGYDLKIQRCYSVERFYSYLQEHFTKTANLILQFIRLDDIAQSPYDLSYLCKTSDSSLLINIANLSRTLNINSRAGAMVEQRTVNGTHSFLVYSAAAPITDRPKIINLILSATEN